MHSKFRIAVIFTAVWIVLNEVGAIPQTNIYGLSHFQQLPMVLQAIIVGILCAVLIRPSWINLPEPEKNTEED